MLSCINLNFVPFRLFFSVFVFAVRHRFLRKRGEAFLSFTFFCFVFPFCGEHTHDEVWGLSLLMEAAIEKEELGRERLREEKGGRDGKRERKKKSMIKIIVNWRGSVNSNHRGVWFKCLFCISKRTSLTKHVLFFSKVSNYFSLSFFFSAIEMRCILNTMLMRRHLHT